MFLFFFEKERVKCGWKPNTLFGGSQVDSVEEHSDEPAQGKALLVRGLQEMPTIRHTPVDGIRGRGPASTQGTDAVWTHSGNVRLTHS